MPQIRPITDLQDSNEISKLCHSSGEPVFMTRDGYGDLVVMSMETYDEMLACIATDQAIAEAELTAQNGVLYDAREVLTSLRERYFGGV